MRKLLQKTRGLIRGTSSSVLLSIGIHILILLLAGGVVVFSILEKQDQKFVPINLSRPKIKLNKPRVKVQDSKPHKSAERIMSTRKSSTMPEMQLPAMTGMGSGLGPIGGFQMVADLSQMTLMGGGRSIGNDLVGTLYDLKRDRAGNYISGMQPSNSENPNYASVVNEFMAKDWDPKVFDRFFRSPNNLYAIHFMFPPFASELALQLFGLEEGVEAGCYAILYKGKIAHPKGGKFRFWGHGDDMLYVRVNKKLVLDARTRGGWNQMLDPPQHWESTDPESRKYFMGIGRAVIGDWFELEPGIPVEMELYFGEDEGGRTAAMLNVQEFGVEYPKNVNGMPILPAFKTAPIPPHIVDEIKYMLIPGESDIEGGPIFSAY